MVEAAAGARKQRPAEGWPGRSRGAMDGVARARPAPPRPSRTNCVGEGERPSGVATEVQPPPGFWGEVGELCEPGGGAARGSAFVRASRGLWRGGGEDREGDGWCCANPARPPPRPSPTNCVGEGERPSGVATEFNLPQGFLGRCEPKRAEGARRTAGVARECRARRVGTFSPTPAAREALTPARPSLVPRYGGRPLPQTTGGVAEGWVG